MKDGIAQVEMFNNQILATKFAEMEYTLHNYHAMMTITINMMDVMSAKLKMVGIVQLIRFHQLFTQDYTPLLTNQIIALIFVEMVFSLTKPHSSVMTTILTIMMDAAAIV